MKEGELYMNSTVIKKIKPSFAKNLIDTRTPLGLFYQFEDGIYTGIDNSTRHAWTEDFPNLRKCKKWLINKSLLAPSMESEEGLNVA